MAKGNVIGFLTWSIFLTVACGLMLGAIFTFAEGLSFFIKERCVLSSSLTIVFVLGMKYSLRHVTPDFNKKSMMVKRVTGWLLVALSLTGFAFSLMSFMDNYRMVQAALTQYGYSYQSYRTDGTYDWLLLQFAGGGIIFSGYIFAWGYFLVKSGPIYSPIWKRLLKVVLYIVATLVLFDNVVYRPYSGWLALPIILVLMSIIVAMSHDYVKVPDAHITEDIEL